VERLPRSHFALHDRLLLVLVRLHNGLDLILLSVAEAEALQRNSRRAAGAHWAARAAHPTHAAPSAWSSSARGGTAGALGIGNRRDGGCHQRGSDAKPDSLCGLRHKSSLCCLTLSA